MTIANNLDTIVAWIQENICPQVQLKQPNDEKNDHRYELKLVHPSAFAMLVPNKERMQPNIATPIPSICTQILKGKDNPKEHLRHLDIQLALSAWNPGEHGTEKMEAVKNPDVLGGYSFQKYQGEPLNQSYQRNYEGWRDVWGFTDKVVQIIENTEYIAGLRVMQEDGIEYGPFTEEGAIVDYYPYWFCWIRFSLECGLARKTPKAYEDLL